MKEESSKKTPIIEAVILSVTGVAVVVLTQLPYRKVEGNPVPAILFNDTDPSVFHAVILSLNFGFFGSFNSLTLRHAYPRLANASMLLSLFSTLSWAAILIYLTFPIFFTFARRTLISLCLRLKEIDIT